MILVELEQTCHACPSQWEGKTDTGAEVYIRYRYGWLSVSVDGRKTHGEQIGDGLDGFMEEDKMLRLIGAEVKATT